MDSSELGFRVRKILGIERVRFFFGGCMCTTSVSVVCCSRSFYIGFDSSLFLAKVCSTSLLDLVGVGLDVGIA